MPSQLAPDIEAQAISLIRGFAMDAPLRAKSGHQGTAMALAPLAHVLYSRILKHDPADPEWPDRDRFVLSNGHASILQYSMLYLTGYGLELADIEAFRQFESRTPGHPEARHTPGVEVTTGPLGQGFGDAVGMAMAERVLRERFGAALVDHHTYVIAGDGCFMEGVSHEAASLAGHLGLGRLICVYDDNRVTIDGPTALSYSDDVGGRFEAYGWNVEYLGEVADDCDALEAALLSARADESRPTLLILRSHIGAPSPDHTDDPAAHGNPFTAEDVTRTKAVMGIPDEPFWSPPELVETYRAAAAERGAAARATLAGGARRARRRRAGRLGRGVGGHRHEGLGGRPADVRAGRGAGHPPGARQGARRRASRPFPGLVSGAADLTGNTGVKLPDDAGHQSAETPGRAAGLLRHPRARHGRGVGRHGDARRRAAGHRHVLRVPRLHAPAGPPGRRCSGPRSCSSSATTRSASARTARPTSPSSTWRRCGPSPACRSSGPPTPTRPPPRGGWPSSTRGPTALVLSRQGIPTRTDGSAVERGAGIVHEPAGAPARRHRRHRQRGRAWPSTPPSGSADEGTPTRVVSLPSWDRFADQGREYRDERAPARRPGAVGRGGDDVRLGALRRRLHRHRALRRQRARAPRSSTSSGSTSSTWCSGPARS